MRRRSKIDAYSQLNRFFRPGLTCHSIISVSEYEISSLAYRFRVSFNVSPRIAVALIGARSHFLGVASGTFKFPDRMVEVRWNA